jgi:hypothetical protein
MESILSLDIVETHVLVWGDNSISITDGKNTSHVYKVFRLHDGKLKIDLIQNLQLTLEIDFIHYIIFRIIAYL